MLMAGAAGVAGVSWLLSWVFRGHDDREAPLQAGVAATIMLPALGMLALVKEETVSPATLDRACVPWFMFVGIVAALLIARQGGAGSLLRASVRLALGAFVTVGVWLLKQ
jgi:hypothetical protein